MFLKEVLNELTAATKPHQNRMKVHSYLNFISTGKHEYVHVTFPTVECAKMYEHKYGICN